MKCKGLEEWCEAENINKFLEIDTFELKGRTALPTSLCLIVWNSKGEIIGTISSKRNVWIIQRRGRCVLDVIDISGDSNYKVIWYFYFRNSNVKGNRNFCSCFCLEFNSNDFYLGKRGNRICLDIRNICWKWFFLNVNDLWEWNVTLPAYSNQGKLVKLEL